MAVLHVQGLVGNARGLCTCGERCLLLALMAVRSSEAGSTQHDTASLPWCDCQLINNHQGLHPCSRWRMFLLHFRSYLKAAAGQGNAVYTEGFSHYCKLGAGSNCTGRRGGRVTVDNR